MLGNTAAMLEEIQGLIVPHYAQKLRKKNANSRSIIFWINLHKN